MRRKGDVGRPCKFWHRWSEWTPGPKWALPTGLWEQRKCGKCGKQDIRP